MGGTIDMASHKTAPNEFYSLRWVLDTIIVDDNIDDNGEYSTMTIYDYEYGYYDRKERVFNGFAKVTENQYQGNDLYRRTERYYRNDSVTTKGLLTVENIMNGDSLLYIFKKNTYQLQTPDYGSDTSHRMTVFPALVRTLTCYFEGDENSTINQEKLFTYESYGNVSQKSITTTSMYTVVVNITYHPQQNDNYCVCIPMSV
jgi:hypothetical protein